MAGVSASMENTLAWNQLSTAQQVQVVLDCDEFEIEPWEWIHGSFTLEAGIAIFADEEMH